MATLAAAVGVNDGCQAPYQAAVGSPSRPSRPFLTLSTALRTPTFSLAFPAGTRRFFGLLQPALSTAAVRFPCLVRLVCLYEHYSIFTPHCQAHRQMTFALLVRSDGLRKNDSSCLRRRHRPISMLQISWHNLLGCIEEPFSSALASCPCAMRMIANLHKSCSWFSETRRCSYLQLYGNLINHCY